MRAEKELKAKTDSEKHPIGLPVFLFLFFLAVAMDIIDLVFEATVVVNIVFGFIFGLILWGTYWAVGAKNIASIIVMLLGWLVELIPVLSILPLNIVTVILVYIVMSPTFKKILRKAPSAPKRRLRKAAEKLRERAERLQKQREETEAAERTV